MEMSSRKYATVQVTLITPIIFESRCLRSAQIDPSRQVWKKCGVCHKTPLRSQNGSEIRTWAIFGRVFARSDVFCEFASCQAALAMRKSCYKKHIQNVANMMQNSSKIRLKSIPKHYKSDARKSEAKIMQKRDQDQKQNLCVSKLPAFLNNAQKQI